MDKVISIYEARTNLSKFVRQAQGGKTIYIGAYGQAQAVLAPLPQQHQINVGVWADKKNLRAYDYSELVGSSESKPAKTKEIEPAGGTTLAPPKTDAGAES
jgi:antitoxin (DNA-binding transcriptional repressor) of toxin-antitoxin stability system